MLINYSPVTSSKYFSTELYVISTQTFLYMQKNSFRFTRPQPVNAKALYSLCGLFTRYQPGCSNNLLFNRAVIYQDFQ